MKIVVALGGNALLQKGRELSIKNEFRAAKKAMRIISKLVVAGQRVIITFGNGPQSGQLLLGHQAVGETDFPLEVLVAESQGQIGHLLAISILNELAGKKILRPVVCVLTHVLVNKNDTGFKNPSKPIGPFYSKIQARSLQKKGLNVVEDAGRGYRLVVASPAPQKILEAKEISKLFLGGSVVIACGGGGIPVIKENGKLKGVNAVIDKDLSSALLARTVLADTLLIATGVDSVFLGFGKPGQKRVSKMSLAQAKKYLGEGEFLAGSMEPKIRAAVEFLEGGGKKVVICSLDNLLKSFNGKSGTTISR